MSDSQQYPKNHFLIKDLKKKSWENKVMRCDKNGTDRITGLLENPQ